MNKALKKCPFCGAGAKMVRTMGGFYYCECENCGVRTKSMQAYDAEKAWNIRTKMRNVKAEGINCTTVGMRLNRIRNKREINIKDLAEAVGTSYFILDAIECGKTTADYSMIVKLAKALNVSTDFILGNSRKESNEQVQSKKI